MVVFYLLDTTKRQDVDLVKVRVSDFKRSVKSVIKSAFAMISNLRKGFGAATKKANLCKMKGYGVRADWRGKNPNL